MPELLPRFFKFQQQREDAKRIAEIILETGEVPGDVRHMRRTADGHNRARARGIPIVGRVSGGGASPGTDPVAALLRKEARGELRR